MTSTVPVTPGGTYRLEAFVDGAIPSCQQRRFLFWTWVSHTWECVRVYDTGPDDEQWEEHRCSVCGLTEFFCVGP